MNVTLDLSDQVVNDLGLAPWEDVLRSILHRVLQSSCCADIFQRFSIGLCDVKLGNEFNVSIVVR